MKECSIPEVAASVQAVGEFLTERQSARPWPGRTMAEALDALAWVAEPATALLRERLGVLRPRAGWLDGEYAAGVPGTGEWWCCDTVDGAAQYLNALPHWAVTATLLRDGEPVLAVVHAPLQRATYTAELGGGARLNGRPIAPPERDPDTCVIGTGQPPTAGPAELRRAGDSLAAVAARVLAVRNLGPAALQLAQVGSGQLNGFWEYGADPVTLLPGALIAREAGALVTDAEGRRWTPAADTLLAAHPRLHPGLLDALALTGQLAHD
ncbi:inositol monophosphatase family protein [Kitasatospora sp. NPDC096147]|uniref:inositol monophosphatase family protein n=1 Tax=Kitasatospora sp. NPDC096147 TaxID=3364093 RepID=UPI0037F46EDB